MRSNMMSQFQGNPLFQQAQQMAQGKTPEQLRQTCINLCRNKGIDFDQAFNQFQSQFPGMK
jgi:hypothetical protein